MNEKEYNNIVSSAVEECDKICLSAREEFNKINESATRERKKIVLSAREEYDKIVLSAHKECNKIVDSAREELEKSKGDSLIRCAACEETVDSWRTVGKAFVCVNCQKIFKQILVANDINNEELGLDDKEVLEG